MVIFMVYIIMNLRNRNWNIHRGNTTWKTQKIPVILPLPLAPLDPCFLDDARKYIFPRLSGGFFRKLPKNRVWNVGSLFFSWFFTAFSCVKNRVWNVGSLFFTETYGFEGGTYRSRGHGSDKGVWMHSFW